MYVALDIETTGLDPDTCQILEVAAICFDPLKTQQSKFHRLIKPTIIVGQLDALIMHHDLFKELKNTVTHSVEDVVSNLVDFIHFTCHGQKTTLVGKNLRFDLGFLAGVESWCETMFHHRILDIGSLCWQPGDDPLPNLEECLRRCKLPDQINHRAMSDAQACVDIVRFKCQS